MNHLKAIFSGMLLTCRYHTGAAAGVSERTILLSGSVVNTACGSVSKRQNSRRTVNRHLNIAACNGEPASVRDSVSLKVNLVRGRLPQSMGTYVLLGAE